MADLSYTFTESGSKDSWVVVGAPQTISFKKADFPTVELVAKAMENKGNLNLSKSKTIAGFYFANPPKVYKELKLKQVAVTFTNAETELAKVRESLSDFDLAF